MRISRGFADTESYGQVHYITAGSGRPLILLHQSPSSSAAFMPLIPALAEERQVFALDTIGYGASDAPDAQPTLADYGNSVVQVIDALGFDKAPIHGNHTGAGIAIAAASRHPDRVSALSLTTIPYFSGDQADAIRKSVSGPTMLTDGLKDDGSHFSTVYTALRGSGQSVEQATATTIDRVRMGARVHWGLEALFSADLPAMMRDLKVPLQVMVGGEDAIRANTEAARAYLPDHEFMVSEKGRYMSDLAPFLTANILRFLRENDV